MATKKQTKGSSAVAEGPDYTLPEGAPEWMRIAFEGARKIRESGIKLPSDMAENHRDYARGRKRV